ncbi:DsbA family protein [Halorientalis salina]|uniref:DsbA family protein n=1 Tax=Halorientalis salina TaxID=2932266 RepID=UPI0010AD033B|nr:thioredoxin domain-containing protein [Halorientalis salina]
MDFPGSPTTRRALLGGVGTLAAGGGVVFGASRLDSSPSAESTPSKSAELPFHSSSETTAVGIDLSGHPIMGNRSAGIDMYYWSDYQCPFCRRFEANAFPKLIDEHVRSGDVRVVFIEYPYLTEGSMTAAVMDRCVWRQVRDDRPGRYWAWHSKLFDEQGEKNSGWLARENLLEITRGVDGVDADAVETCMDDRGAEIESAIDDDVATAQEFGIRGSPAFVLFNRESEKAGKIVGAQPYDQFDEAISKIQNA